MPAAVTPRALSLALAALVLAGGCGGGGDGDANESGDAVGVTSSTTGLMDANGAPVTEPGGGAAGSGGSGTGSGSGSGSGSGTTKGPERTDIPLAGRYTYDYAPEGGSASERLLDVRDGGERRGDVRQLLYFGAGDTATAQQVVWLGTDRYYVEAEQRAQGSKRGALCAWKPGLIDLDLPLQAGKSWTGDSTCSNESGTRRRKVQARVTGSEQMVIGGQTVKVWVIERTVETHTEATGSNVKVTSDEKRVTTDRVSADRHLLVSSSGTESATVNGVPSASTRFTLTLRNLTPAPLPGA